MKKLVSPGLVLIVSPPRFSLGRLFDPWATHGFYFYVFGLTNCASGRYVAYTKWALVSGAIFYYPGNFYPDYVTGQTAVNSVQKYISAGGYVGEEGEWYNAVFRPLAADKIPDADWNAYRAAH